MYVTNNKEPWTLNLGTYQMRKSLEISAADKHKYTCSATHLSLDNTLVIDLGNEVLPIHKGSEVLMILHLHLHLSDAFIQSDLQLHSGYTFSLVHVIPGNRTLIESLGIEY